MLTTLILLTTIASATCPEPATSGDLVSSVSAAETAFAAMDPTAFRRARKLAEDQLECLGETLTPLDAGSFHRVLAMDAFMAKDQQEAIASFRAVHAALPAYVLPTSIAVEGSPLRTLFDQAGELGQGEPRALEVPPGLALMVDGARAMVIPSERPYVLQVLSASGGVTWTGHLGAGESPPTWNVIVAEEAAVTVAPAPVPVEPVQPALPSEPPERVGPKLPVLAGAGAALVAAGALYGVAGVKKAEYESPDGYADMTAADLDSLRSTTNALVFTSAGLGVVGIGLGTVAFLEVRW